MSQYKISKVNVLNSVQLLKDYILGIQLDPSLTDPLWSMADERQQDTEDISLSFYHASGDRLGETDTNSRYHLNHKMIHPRTVRQFLLALEQFSLFLVPKTKNIVKTSDIAI